jgi:hypothetical protein
MNRQLKLDLLVTALEGGSNYWYLIKDDGLKIIANYGKGLPLADRIMLAVDNEEHIPIHDNEGYDSYDVNDDSLLGYITKENIAKAGRLMKSDYPEHHRNALDEDYDAETGDVWFQLVVLGDVTFG